MNEQNIDKAFREKLDGFSPQPPLHIWDNIQGRLQAQKRRRRIVILSRIAAAAVVALAFFAGWQLNEESDKIIPEQTETRTGWPAQTQKGTDRDMAKGENATSIQIKTEEGKNPKEKLFLSKNNAVKNIATTNKGREVATAGLQTKETLMPDRAGENKNNGSGIKPNLELLDKINAFFKEDSENKLHVKHKTSRENAISDYDRILIAENISKLRNNKKEKRKWKIGMNVAPGYSSQTTNYSEDYSSSMTYSGREGNADISGGLSVQMKAGKRWSIESGLYYAQNGQRSSNYSKSDRGEIAYSPASADENLYLNTYFNTAIDLTGGQAAMNSSAGVIQFAQIPEGVYLAEGLDKAVYAYSSSLLTDGNFSQIFDLVEIPLFFRYSLVNSKVGVELLGGLNAGIIAGNNVYMDTGNGSQNVGKTSDISQVNLSGTIGIGLNYALNKRISLAVEPRFNYYLNSVNKNPDIDFHPYRIGIYTGVYYSF